MNWFDYVVWSMIVLVFLGLLFICTMWHYLGGNRTITTTKCKLGEGIYIYQEFQDNYVPLTKRKLKIYSHLMKLIPIEREEIINFMGLYFDNPSRLTDPSKARCTLGIYIQGHRSPSYMGSTLITRINSQDEFKDFKFCEIGEMEILKTEFAYKVGCSFEISSLKCLPVLLRDVQKVGGGLLEIGANDNQVPLPNMQIIPIKGNMLIHAFPIKGQISSLRITTLTNPVMSKQM